MDNETIADIIAEMRREAGKLEASSYRPHQFLRERIAELRREADRLEAAHERELSKNVSKNGADFGQLGDAAKLREACANIAEYARSAQCHTEDAHVLGYLNQIEGWAKAALAAPPRNCDLYADYSVAATAHKKYHMDYIMRASNKFDFPMEFNEWLLAPATEKEGGNDGR